MSSGHSANNIFDGFFDFFQKQKFDTGTLRFSLYTNAQASLNSGINLKEAVKLPEGENLNEWVAVHVVDFFNRINLIYGTVCDYCTEKTCQKMSGGPKFEYLWQDGQEYKKPTGLSAPKYIALLMDWIESQINDEKVFPTSTETPFPRNFVSHVCKKILTRLFRVFVHVYIHHFDRIVALGAEAHVNTCYKHFYYFVGEFHLVPTKELEPLVVMTERLMAPNSNSEDTHQNQQITFEDCSAMNGTMSTLLAKNFTNPEINSEFENISIAPFSTTGTTTSTSNRTKNQMQNIKVTFEEDK